MYTKSSNHNICLIWSFHHLVRSVKNTFNHFWYFSINYLTKQRHPKILNSISVYSIKTIFQVICLTRNLGEVVCLIQDLPKSPIMTRIQKKKLRCQIFSLFMMMKLGFFRFPVYNLVLGSTVKRCQSHCWIVLWKICIILGKRKIGKVKSWKILKLENWKVIKGKIGKAEN